MNEGDPRDFLHPLFFIAALWYGFPTGIALWHVLSERGIL